MENRSISYRTYDLVDCSGVSMWARKQNDIRTMDHDLIDEHFKDNRFAQSVFDLPRGSVILDAGAHIGTYCLRVFRDRRDFSFIALEPIPENYGMLVKNIMTNDIDMNQVQPLQLALSPESGYITLTNFGNHGSWSALPQNIQSYGEIPVYALSYKDLVSRLRMRYIDYIKLDIEGLEWSVIQNLDLRSVRGMDIELHNIDHSKVIDHLESEGFTVEKYKPQGYDVYR